MLVLPMAEIEVISVTPEISPSRRSSGAATEFAMVSGSAPGRPAKTTMVGISTEGSAETGRKREATIAGQQDAEREQEGRDGAGDEGGGEGHCRCGAVLSPSWPGWTCRAPSPAGAKAHKYKPEISTRPPSSGCFLHGRKQRRCSPAAERGALALTVLLERFHREWNRRGTSRREARSAEAVLGSSGRRLRSRSSLLAMTVFTLGESALSFQQERGRPVPPSAVLNPEDAGPSHARRHGQRRLAGR